MDQKDTEGMSCAARAAEEDLKDRQTKKLVWRLVLSVLFLLPLMYILVGHMVPGWALPPILRDHVPGMVLAEIVLALAVSGIGRRYFKSDNTNAPEGESQVTDITNSPQGEFHVTDIIPQETIAVEHLMQTALMLEGQSGHKHAKAVVSFMEENGVPLHTPERFTQLSGNGMEAAFEGKTYLTGEEEAVRERLAGDSERKKFDIFYKCNRIDYLERQGKTPLFFAEDGILLGAIAVAEKKH